MAGPFITVVSIDGGLQCGNKLTVITPTEIVDASKKENNSTIFNTNRQQENNNVPPTETETVQPIITNSIKQSNNKGKVSAIPTLVGADRKPNINNNNVTASAAAAYVTVVSLAEQQMKKLQQLNQDEEKPVYKENDEEIIVEVDDIFSKGIKSSGIPVKSYKNHINAKSIVQLENHIKPYNNNNGRLPTSRSSPAISEEQIITFSNKVKGGKNVHERNSSFVEIESTKDDNGLVEKDKKWQWNENAEIPSVVKEYVTVLRLPGEKLGFGLRFEGGVTNPVDKVRHLFIQSVMPNSPSNKVSRYIFKYIYVCIL
jgi:hypothetical protein